MCHDQGIQKATISIIRSFIHSSFITPKQHEYKKMSDASDFLMSQVH